MEKNTKKGFFFKKYEAPNLSPFDKLFEIFKELITHTSGDFEEAIDWLRQLDVEYKLTDADYTIDDFIEDLKKNNSITSVSYNEKRPDELINLNWIFFLLLFIISAEWFIRKYNGLL